jgi:ketosteroid isomerase-like protein
MKRVLLLVALMLLMVSARGGGNQMSDAEAMMQDWKVALESLDLEKTMSFYADDIVWDDAAAKDLLTTKSEVMEMFRWFYGLTNMRMDVTFYFISGDGKWATAEWTWSGTEGALNYSIKGISILEIRDDKIVRETIYYDRTSSPY